MTQEWKTTKLLTLRGKTTATLLKGQSPRALLRAIGQVPEKKIPGATLPVEVHSFAGKKVVVRTCAPGGITNKASKGREVACMPPREIFEILQELDEKKAEIVETPVALVERKKQHILVTLAKPHETSLDKVLVDKSVPEHEKLRLAMKAIKLVARLNAMGYAHGAPVPRNIVVAKNGDVSLIDPKLLERYKNADESHESRASLMHPFTEAWRSETLTDQVSIKRKLILIGLLHSAYDEEYLRVRREQH